MRTMTRVALMLVRLLGVVLLMLGLVFWGGNVLGLVNVHMLLGVVFVLALWTLAAIAGVARQPAGLVALGVVWGLVVLALGMVQKGLLPGSAH